MNPTTKNLTIYTYIVLAKEFVEKYEDYVSGKANYNRTID